MLNSVTMTGRLTRDVDLRYTQSGTAVGSFTLAVDRQFKSKSGERETDFVNCQVWRKSAENFANFTHKGALVGVQGRIQTRTYDDKNGNKVFVTEVIVDSFALLEPKQSSQNSGSPQRNQSAPGNTNRPRTNTNNQFANNEQSISISDSDLPF
ncbi:single-stranded DNA-binding protein [Lacticaseibacillus paracasei]|uniref:single-stranded DNA-binding protein n=1 Tax=Lacticaseibacillus paracasei TaxID=1597 RepID=UPI0021A39F52|nr:single-stranded DNA-binding protein [Lacticaseibacillus paracasei]MCT3326980.1 single-stranded DNA-binding protein [Lacticaseibacillus paracasei]